MKINEIILDQCICMRSSSHHGMTDHHNCDHKPVWIVVDGVASLHCEHSHTAPFVLEHQATEEELVRIDELLEQGGES